MLFAIILFWFCLVVLCYTYFGYGLILYFFNRIGIGKSKFESVDWTTLPAITLVVPVFNEALVLEDKISNCIKLDYPTDKLNIIFISDGSTDLSVNIINHFPRIVHLTQADRAGKMAAINRAMTFVTTPFVLFSDANSFLNPESIKKIVAHYTNEKVGGVAGEKKVAYSGRHAAMGLGEGFYWKYESVLKQLDSDFNTVVGAAGEVFSMRTSLFHPLSEDTILDDLNLSLKICLQGYKVVYEPNAFAVEAPSLNLAEESKRRVRIAAGAFQSMYRMSYFKHVFKYPLLSFQFASRRVLRWIVCPAALLVLYISNMYIMLYQPVLGYEAFFFLQSIFYMSAIVGWLFYGSNIRFYGFFLPFYFVFMNVSIIKGLVKFLTGKQSILWEKSVRNTLQTQGYI